MLEREVLEHSETLAIEAQTEIEEEIQPEIERRRYAVNAMMTLCKVVSRT